MAGSSMSVDVMVRLRDRLSGPLGRLKKALRSFSNIVKVGAVAAITAFTAAMTASILEAIKFQKLWAEANKTLGMSKYALGLLKGDLDDLAAKIPLARDQFVEMAEQAGNIGIRGREALVEFIELAAKMGLTFDGVDPKQGARFLGNWRESLGYTHAELAKTVDQINYLGNTTNAGAGPLAQFASDSLAIGDAAGYAREETLALGAAVIAAGKAPEVASTGFRAMNRLLTGGVANLSKAQSRIVDQLGLDMDAIQKQMQTDATGAIRAVTEAISKMPIEQRSSIVNQLFGEEAQRVFGPLLGDIRKLEIALGRIDALKKNSAGSAEAEFLGVSDTVTANWRKLLNVFSRLRDEAGQPYLEPINNALKSTIELLTTLDERVTVFDRMKSSTSGFFRGLGLSRNSRLLGFMGDQLERIRNFMFGRVGGDPGEELAKGFNKAHQAGEKLAGFLADLEGKYLEGLSRSVKALTGLELPDLSALAIDKSKAAGTVILAEGFALLSTAWKALSSFGSGFMSGFMDNIGDGLSRWSGLGEDISELGAAFGDLYYSLKELLGLDNDDMENIKSFGEVLGTLTAGAVGIAGDTLQLLAKALKAIIDAVTQFLNLLQGKPVDWELLQGNGAEILEQIGDLINAILEPLGNLLDMDLTIDWSSLSNGLKEVANDMIDTLNLLIRDVNNALSYIGLGGIGEIGKFETSQSNPVAANDNVPGKQVSLPNKLDTKAVNYNDRLNNAWADAAVTSTSGSNVQRVEFSPLQHEVTSKVDVGGGVRVDVTGPAKVTGVTSTNPNAPVTANTGRAVGRQ